MPTDNDDLRPAGTWYPMDSEETDYVPVDFEDQLDTGETISSVTTTCEAIEGTDASASSRLSGSPQTTGSAVRQFLTGVLADVVYLVRFKATTSTGRILVIAGKLPVVREGGEAA